MGYLSARTPSGAINPGWNEDASIWTTLGLTDLDIKNVTSVNVNESTDSIAIYGGYVEGMTTKEITINFNDTISTNQGDSNYYAIGDTVGTYGIITNVSTDKPADGVVSSTLTISIRSAA